MVKIGTSHEIPEVKNPPSSRGHGFNPGLRELGLGDRAFKPTGPQSACRN